MGHLRKGLADGRRQALRDGRPERLGDVGRALASRGEASHTWSATTSDAGSGTGIAASAEGVYVAGLIGDNVVLWKYEP